MNKTDLSTLVNGCVSSYVARGIYNTATRRQVAIQIIRHLPDKLKGERTIKFLELDLKHADKQAETYDTTASCITARLWPYISYLNKQSNV